MYDFTKEPNKKELTLFLLPIICSGIFQQLYSLINTAVVSRYLSYEAVAVIGACSSYHSLQNFIFVGMTTGFGFYIYRCIGTRDTEKFRHSFWGAFFLSGLMAVLGILLPFLSQILMELADISLELQADAQKYLFFLFAGSGFLGFKNLFYCTLQGMGETRFPGFVSMAGVVTHTLLTVFLIAGAKLGVEASALAIVLNNAFLSACLFIYLLFYDKNLFHQISFLNIPTNIWIELLKNGTVKSGMMTIIGIGALFMQKAVNGLSTELIAANTYANTVNSVLMEPLAAYAVAAGIITGQNEGCHNLKNIQKYNRYLIRRDFLWCACFIFLNLIASPHMILLLSGSKTSIDVMEAGSLWLRICCFGYPILCILLICRNALQSLGEYKILPVLGIMESLVNIGMALFVSRYGYLFVCFAIVLKWAVPGITAWIWYQRSIKKRKKKWGGLQNMKEKRSYDQEVLEWRWHQLRLQKKYKNTPAGFSDREAEKTAFDQWKNDVQKFRGDQEYHILSESIDSSKEIFAGRQKELSILLEKMERSSGPVVVYGMGGIGKSALVRAYIRNFGKNYDHVLFLTFQSSMQSLITDDFGIRISNLQYRAEQYGSFRRYFQIKYDILRRIAQREHLLMIIDDCNVKKDKDMQKVFSLPCHILVTTRRNPAIWGNYEGLHIQELKSEEEWTEFIDNYRTKEFTQEELMHLHSYRNKVQGHTLMMQQKIRNPGKDFQSISDFKKGLFQCFPLKKEEKQAITYLSVMPVQGIPANMFRLISKVSDETIRQLKNDLFVQSAWSDSWNDELLYLHPIIAESAQLMFCPSPSNCGKLIMGMRDYLSGVTNESNTWNRTILENRRLEVYVFAFIKAFPSPAPWLAEAFDELATFLWIQQYFREAKAYILKTYEAVEQYYGDRHQMTGQIALRVAAAYYNNLEFEEAEKWYWKGYEILQSCPPLNLLYDFFQSSVHHKIARMYRYENRLTEGLHFAEASIQYTEGFLLKNPAAPETTLNQYKRILNSCRLEKGKILLCMGRIEEAEQICEKIYQTIPPSLMQEFLINEFQDFRIELLMRRKKYDKAEILLRENVERAIHFRGESFKDTLSCMERLGNICLMQGKEKEALEVYEHIIRCLQRNYPLQSEWLNRVAEKMEPLV